MGTPADYANLVVRPGVDARRRVVAALEEYGLRGVCGLWNPTSGRSDGVTQTRTAVLICEDAQGHRLCVKFYQDSEAGRSGLRGHARCLQVVSRAVPVPEIVAVEEDAATLGLPGLVTAYVGEPLDHTISMLSDRERITLAEEIADSLVALSGLDLSGSGLLVPTVEELRRKVAGRFAHDARWHVDRAPAADASARGLVLHGATILANAEVAVSAARLCHRDLAASNIMVRNGLLSGFVDWDYAGVDPPELDLGSCMLGFLVTVPIPKPERIVFLQVMLRRYRSRAEAPTDAAGAMPLLFALDSLLDWIIGGKNAPMDDLIWALSGITGAIEEEAPLGAVLR